MPRLLVFSDIHNDRQALERLLDIDADYYFAAGDLVSWDNRCALHVAVQDFDRTQLRRMIRCSIGTGVPLRRAAPLSA